MSTKRSGIVYLFGLLYLFVSMSTASELDTVIDVPEAETAATSESYAGSESNPFWFASVETMFLDTRARSGGLITLSFDDSSTGGTEISFNSGSGYDGYAIAPRLNLGRQFNEKWGVVARYFHLNASKTDFPRLTAGTTPLPTFGTYFEIDSVQMAAIDVEAVRSFQPGASKIDLSFGARHASLDVDSQLSAFGVITTGNFANILLANGCAFDGDGVTGGAMWRRPLNNSPVSLFLGARGSQLWGHSDSIGRVSGTVASSPSAPLVGAATVTRNNAESELRIFETQIGIQVDFELRHFPANAFLRVAAEYQDWDLDGPPTGGAGFGGTIGTLTTNSFASAGLSDTELMGATITTGFNW
jgi:hypothetical protein